MDDKTLPASLVVRVERMPFAGLRESGLAMDGIPYTMEDMQIKKLTVIRSKEL